MSTPPPTLSKPAAATGSDHDALPSGTRFGEFEILRVLGVGGFGIVYLAQDHSLEREVALKEYMPASLAARGDGPQITIRSSAFAETYAIGLRSFINEARLLARFDHPSLVKVYRFWEDNATAYMVMPFLQGTTLRDTRRGMAHPPDEAWIKSVITPILSALELLHREGVYHRDIAPDNILLPRDGPPVLLDFGAARRVISDRTQSLTAILKPSYAPIEQYAEMTQLRQGPWTDLYALGAVVHYLVFGVPPAPATARAVAEDGDAIENRVVPGISPRFMEAMAWMLAVRPNQRPQSGEQLRAVLDGHAEIPPRGRPGMTIPGGLAPAGPQIETAADATRINTAYVPTQMPTSRNAPPTSFHPTTQMPTARQTPGPRQATGVQPPAPQTPPQPTAPTTQRPAGAAISPPPAAQRTTATAAQPTAQRPAATTQQTPARAPAAGVPPTAAAEAGAAARSGPPSVSPPLAGAASAKAPTRSGTSSKPAPLAATGTDGRPSQFPASQFPASRPAPLGTATADAAPSAPRSKPWLLIAGGGIAVAVAIAAGVQLAGRRDVAPAGPAPAASAAASAAALPSTVPVNQSTSPTETILEGSKGDASTSPPVAAGPGKTTPPVADTETTLKSDASAKLDTTTKPGATPAADAASAARVRPPGRPVPRAEDAAASSAFGSPTTPRPNDGAASPSPMPGYPQGQQQQPNATRQQAQQPPQYAPPRHEETAAEFCGRTNNGFFAINVCKDEKCEEPRYRNTGDCPAVLARKRQREH
jgi:serine/threonine protein kinase